MNNFIKITYSTLLIGLWSTTIFEKGLPYFVERFGFSLANVFSLLFLLMSIFLLASKYIKLYYTDFFKQNSIMLLLFVIYWLMAFLGIIYTEEKDSALLVCAQFFIYTTMGLFSYFYLNMLPYGQRRKLFFLIGLFSLLLLIIFSILQLITGEVLQEANRGAIAASRDYNVLTFSLILSLLLIFLIFYQNQKNFLYFKLFIYFLLLTVIIGIGVISGSRRAIMIYGPISAFVPLILLYRFNLIKYFMKYSFIIMILFLIVVILASFFQPGRVSEILDKDRIDLVERKMDRAFGFITGRHDDTSSRTERWENAFNVLSTFSFLELVIGRGTRSYFAEPEFIRIEGNKDSPHNFLLAAFIEGGIIKLIIIILFSLIWLKSFWINGNRDYWLANFLIISSTLWLISVTISAEEFFSSKQFFILILTHASLVSYEKNQLFIKDI